MSRYRKWVLTLGIVMVTPGIATAGPTLFPFFKTKAARPDSQSEAIRNQQTADAIAAAVRNAKLSGYDISIEYQDGTATLTGSVADVELMRKAAEIVATVPGVKKVNNRLKIVGPSAEAENPSSSGRFQGNTFRLSKEPSPIQPTGYTPQQVVQPRKSAEESRKSESRNQQIAQKVADELMKAGLSGYDIVIRYQGGTLQLSGTVTDAGQLQMAQKVVSGIPEVQNVRNLLKVQGDGDSAVRHAHAERRHGYPPLAPAGYQPMPGSQPPVPGQNGPMPPTSGAPPAAVPQSYGHPGPGAATAVFNTPHMPEHAWPAHAQYPNYAAVGYPKQYSASAWPYIGPFYPYPQVPLGWRQVALQWDDGAWKLNFNPRTDRWWWFLNPKNW